MRRRNGGRVLRQAEALALAAGTLWLVSVTAGSEDAGAAVRSLRAAAAEAVVRGELPVLGDGLHGLSVPAALALSQSPLLYSTGDGALWRRGNGPPEGTEAGEAGPGGTETGEAEPGGMETEAAGTGGTEADGGPAAPETPAVEDAPSGGGTAEPLREEAAQWKEPPESRREEAYQPEVENGMRARTLIPSGPSGYTVAGRVYISSSRQDRLDADALLDTFDAHLTGEAPQILILHSHGSEAYTPLPGTEVVWSGDHRTTDPRYSVVKCGDVMAAAFAEAGISVLHDRTLYDYPEYTGSYDRSLAAINSYLAQYPSIHFILDVHRDSISDGAGNQYKVISEIEGVGAAAQLTLVMGSDGSGAAHPRWMENLKLAVAIQEQICGKYPTLMRPLLLRKSRYNQHATTGSLLVEVGASGNAPEEAQLAARLFAEEMAEVLLARTK